MESDYSTENVIIAMNPKNEKDLIDYLITVKGSSIPGFSSDQVTQGSLSGILGSRIVVSNNVVADSVFVGDPTGCTWKAFEPLHAETENIMGKGTKIAVWENGVAILTDPNKMFLITDTDT